MTRPIPDGVPVSENQTLPSFVAVIPFGIVIGKLVEFDGCSDAVVTPGVTSPIPGAAGTVNHT